MTMFSVMTFIFSDIPLNTDLLETIRSDKVVMVLIQTLIMAHSIVERTPLILLQIINFFRRIANA